MSLSNKRLVENSTQNITKKTRYTPLTEKDLGVCIHCYFFQQDRPIEIKEEGVEILCKGAGKRVLANLALKNTEDCVHYPVQTTLSKFQKNLRRK